MEIWKIDHKTACFGVFFFWRREMEGACFNPCIRVQTRLDRNLKEGGKSRWRGGRGAHMQADTHTDTQTQQRSHSQPCHPILSQSGKMLYFPSKLKCQLILMWRWRVPGTQCTNTQTAFALTDTSLEFQIAPDPAAISWWSHAHGSLREVRAGLIGPSVTAHPICHMEVISKLRCSRGMGGCLVA